MKKILIIAAVAFAAFASNAAATSWKCTGGNIYGADGTTLYEGAIQIWASGGDLASATMLYEGEISGGKFGSAFTFTATTVTPDKSYDVYFKIFSTKGGAEYELASATKSATATGTGTATVGFSDQKTFTQTTTNWKAVSTPEPTSGLLLLLGMAGLALKRKIA